MDKTQSYYIQSCNILRYKLETIAWCEEKIKSFEQVSDDAIDALVDTLKQMSEKQVAEFMSTIKDPKKYALLKSAYLRVNPSSFVGEM